MRRRIHGAVLATAFSLIAADIATAAPTWSTPIPIAPQLSDGANAGAAFPAVAENAAGDAVITWTTRTGVKAMTHERAGSWSEPTLIFEDTFFAGGRAFVDADGNAIVAHVGHGSVPFRSYLELRSHRRGALQWDPPITLSDPAEMSASNDATIVFDRDGNAYAAWTGYYYGPPASGYFVQMSMRPAGGSWTKPIELSARGENAPRGVALAVDGDGNLLALWVKAGPRAENPVVEAAVRSATTRAWGEPAQLSSAGRDAGDLSVAFDGSGNAVAAWRVDVGSGLSFLESSYRAADGTWQPRRRFTSLPDAFTNLSLAVDSSGTAVAVWAIRRPGNGAKFVEASSQRGGGPWQPATTLFRSNTDYPAPALAIDARGNAVAVWGGHRLALRAALRPAASGRWLPPVQIADGGSGPTVAMDGYGNATAAFSNGALFLAELRGTGPILADVSVPTFGPLSAPTTFAAVSVPWAAQLEQPWPVWNWGEEPSSAGSGQRFDAPTGSHTFRRAGTYTVSIWARDLAGETTIERHDITITRDAVGNIRRPTIRGVARVGATLTCFRGVWVGARPLRFEYTWFRDGKDVASVPAVRVARSDARHRFVCRVTATNRLNTETATSPAVRIRR